MKVSVDSGAAGHALLEGMFQRVKLERKTSPKRFVVANAGRIRDLGERLFHSRQTMEFKAA